MTVSTFTAAEQGRGYLDLMKLRVVELLLVTTVPALVLAEGKLPGLVVTAASIIGGTLAAGAANAYNMIIESDLDKLMARTAKRPLVTGVLNKVQATVFATIVAIISLVIFWFFTTPLATLLYNAATGNLSGTTLEWRDESAVTVVLAAQGYPAAPQSGGVISGFSSINNVSIFHAGTSLKEEVLVSSGGRVLTVTGVGEDLTEARNLAYRAISQISLAGSFYRTDIALNASVAEKGN